MASLLLLLVKRVIDVCLTFNFYVQHVIYRTIREMRQQRHFDPNAFGIRMQKRCMYTHSAARIIFRMERR